MPWDLSGLSTKESLQQGYYTVSVDDNLILISDVIYVPKPFSCFSHRATWTRTSRPPCCRSSAWDRSLCVKASKPCCYLLTQIHCFHIPCCKVFLLWPLWAPSVCLLTNLCWQAVRKHILLHLKSKKSPGCRYRRTPAAFSFRYTENKNSAVKAKCNQLLVCRNTLQLLVHSM